MNNFEAKRQYDNELQVMKVIKKLHNSKGTNIGAPFKVFSI